MDESQLRSIPMFAQLSKRDLARVAQLADEVKLDEGARLVREGEYAYEFFAIEDGTVEVTHEGRVFAELGPGDFFGELGVMSLGLRSADVVATSPVTVIVITDWNFRRIVKEMPAVAQDIKAAIAERSRDYVARQV